MHNFELPTNIKQIGSIDEGIRIYVEDYVCTYLKQYAKAADHCEKVAFLIGKHLIIDSQSVLFISGAIEGKYSTYEDGIEIFTDQSFTYAEEQIDKYFKGFEIVGWMQSQPGYSIFLNPSYGDYHMVNFKRKYQVLFVIDPVEKLNMFYSWNSDRTALIDKNGYFVYYDKNPGMQDYMLDNKLINLELQEKKAILETSERPRQHKAEIQELLGKQPSKKSIRDRTSSTRKTNYAESIHINLPTPRQRKKPRTEQEEAKLVNMLVSLSAVLVVICFIMGAGLIQNDGKINNLQVKLETLTNSYDFLASQIKSGDVPVFAEQKQNFDSIGENLILEENKQTEPTEVVEEPAENTIVEEVAEPVEAVENTTTVEPEPEPVQEGLVINVVPEENIIPETYVVQKGDNLSYISLKFYGTKNRAQDIMDANGITDPNTIFFGKVLKLPR